MTTSRPSFRWPLAHLRSISSGFTARRSYGQHNAIDIPAPLGTTVLAPASGRVAFAGRAGSCGLTVWIDHVAGWRTHHCHLSAFHVSTGSPVAKGSRIGNVGSTGESTGPHLHFALFAPSRPARGHSSYIPWLRKWAVNPTHYLQEVDHMDQTTFDRMHDIAHDTTTKRRYDTIRAGGSASKLAARNGITLARLKVLNPGGPRSGKWRLVYKGEKFRVS